MPAPTQHRSYRPDIDGLRALAVLSVLAFHAFPARFPGGFLGVDVFFTISGFVITRQILAEFADGKFSLAVFYYRRLRRIFPALLLTMAAVSLGAAACLLDSELHRLAAYVVSATLFSANLYSWATVDYFGPAAVSQPLLHLWSLGIEEQFYFVWPLVLYGAYRRNWSLPLTFVLLVLSFALWVVFRVEDTSGAFYLPHFRAWELLAGCLPAVLEARRPLVAATAASERSWQWRQELACLTAFAALLWLVSGIAASAVVTHWRQPAVIVCATALLAGPPQTRLTGGLLGLAVPRYIGRISFPLYLTHWPLLSFAAIVLGEVDKWQRLELLGLATVLAVLMHHAVEVPIRRRAPTLALGAVLGGAMLALALAVAVLASPRPGSGDPRERFIAEAARAAHQDEYGALTHVECGFIDPVTGLGKLALPANCLARAGSGSWLLWGDSHAQQLRYGLQSLLPPGTPMSQVTTFGCAARWISPTDAERSICDRANRFAVDEIARLRPRVVVVAERDRYLEADWPKLQAHLADLGVQQLVVVGPVPQWVSYLPRTLAFQLDRGVPDRMAVRQVSTTFQEDSELRRLLAGRPGLQYVSMIQRFCTAQGCLIALPEGSRRVLTTLDYGHLTLTASRYAAAAIVSQVLER